jgi:hypothetical protein
MQLHSIPGVLVMNVVDTTEMSPNNPMRMSSSFPLHFTVTESLDDWVLEHVEVVPIEASNVLKKRRRKMNHHKYKKLRKRMRALRRKLE